MLAFQSRYRDDPFLFCEEILGLVPDENQRKIIQSVLDNKYSAVSSGRGIGKTFVITMLAGWTLTTRPEAVVLVTSVASEIDPTGICEVVGTTAEVGVRVVGGVAEGTARSVGL